MKKLHLLNMSSWLTAWDAENNPYDDIEQFYMVCGVTMYSETPEEGWEEEVEDGVNCEECLERISMTLLGELP